MHRDVQRSISVEVDGAHVGEAKLLLGKQGFATRVEGAGGIPYEFAEGAIAATKAWAAGLASEPALVILDELGKLEAEGRGHMELWPAVVAV